jgi:hypothetical protein
MQRSTLIVELLKRDLISISKFGRGNHCIMTPEIPPSLERRRTISQHLWRLAGDPIDLATACYSCHFLKGPHAPTTWGFSMPAGYDFHISSIWKSGQQCPVECGIHFAERNQGGSIFTCRFQGLPIAHFAPLSHI